MFRKCLVLCFVLAAVSTLLAQVIPPGALSANKPVFFEGRQVARTGATGDLALALDSTKNYVLLHQECSRYEIVLADSEEAKRCERDDGTRTEQGCRRCEIAGYLVGGKWTAATPSSAMTGGNDLFSFHVNGGVKSTAFTNADQACATITAQLTNLGYNQGVACDTDDSGIGGAVGGGITLNVSPNVGIYAGVQYERLGESAHAVEQAGRINVPGTASNLLFSVTNTNTIDLFNIDLGVSVGNDWIRVLPYAAYGRASIDRRLVDRLLGGPPGTVIPTTQVAGGTTTSETHKWGLGGGIRVLVYPGGWPFGVIGQYQRRTINEAFAPDDSGRNPVDFQLRGFLLGVDVRF